MTYRRKDTVYRRARAAGYRARSAYKLTELDDRFGLLRRGAAVVDLGAWPGGWLQFVRERVGPEGVVVGLDVVPVEPLPFPNVHALVGDVRDPADVRRVAVALGRPADLVLSDLAPKLSGVQHTDEARMGELVDATVAALPTLLRRGGTVVMKLFMSSAYDATVKALREVFSDVRATRPGATREASAELYAIARDYGRGGR
jgi:23S rRNA (uridine2552-2'-O)-methyltransferase